MSEFVTCEDREGLAIVQLNRPKVNALSTTVLDEVASVFGELHNNLPRAVILWGGERCFSAGADIDELTQPDAGSEVADAFRRATEVIETLPRVVVAAITGFALGGGLELALAADFRVASAQAKLGTPEVSLGILPGGGATARLPELVGMQRARQLLLTGQSIAADTAREWGLVDEVAGDDDAFTLAREFAQRFVAGPGLAHAHIKFVLREYREFGYRQALSSEKTAFIDALATEDAHEGITHFREKFDGLPTFRVR